jgi:hypothetical protein
MVSKEEFSKDCKIIELEKEIKVLKRILENIIDCKHKKLNIKVFPFPGVTLEDQPPFNVFCKCGYVPTLLEIEERLNE